MPTLSLQLTVTDDLARQIDLLCTKDDPRQREAVLQTAFEFGLLHLWDLANGVQREFLEQQAIPAAGHFSALRESRRLGVAFRNGDAKPVSLVDGKPVTQPRS